MEKRYLVIDTSLKYIKKNNWKRFLKFIESNENFFQLFSLGIVVEARLHKIKPDNMIITYPFFKDKEI
ncbi:hypothetical protein ACFL43_04080 [Thermodesulfobacteriota bacterium]